MFGIVSVKAHFHDAPSIFKDVKSSQLSVPVLPELKTKYSGCLIQYEFAWINIMQLLPNGLLVAPLHTYIHALADVFKRPDLPMALPKSTLAPTNIVGNDAVKALLFNL